MKFYKFVNMKKFPPVYMIFFCITLCLMSHNGLGNSHVPSSFFNSTAGDILAAFADFNADKLIDIFVICQKGTELHVLIAREEKKTFYRKKLNIKDLKDRITSVMPADFDGDAQNDVLITRQSPDNDKLVEIEIYWGKKNDQVDETPTKIPGKYGDQPTVIDWDADMLPDILLSNETDIISLWKTNGTRNFHQQDDAAFLNPLKLQKPHSNAFLDLNGDYVTDLFITAEDHYEYWIVEENTLSIEHPDNAVVKQASFVDLDQDSKIDLIVPVCIGDCSQSYIVGYFNSMWVNITLPFTNDDGFTWSFILPEDMPDTLGVEFHPTIRWGDYNMDGYPDALVTLQGKMKDGEEVKRLPFILLNEACSDNCDGNSRQLVLDWKSSLADSQYENAVAATFYDIGDDGVLDILVVVADENTVELKGLGNDVPMDACFFKITVVSGKCMTDCPQGRKPYGVNQPGPTVGYNTTRTDGGKQTSVAPQLSQSAHFALQLPYVMFGLGHMPNFVESLTVGIPTPKESEPRKKEWRQIIPNSQLIVIPYPNDHPSWWILKMFVAPSKLVIITGTVLLGACGFVACIVGALHWREKREDKKEKMQDAQKFHFDAM